MERLGIRPEDVHSPKGHWNMIDVLDDGSHDKHGDGCALALGRWDGNPVLALRWNGNEENPIGNPQSRGIPTWFVVPAKYNEAILKGGGLTAEKVALARNFIHAPGPTFKETIEHDMRNGDYIRDKPAHRQILKELISAGGQKQYDPNQDMSLICQLRDSSQMQFIEEIRDAPSITYRITEHGRRVFAECE